MLFLYGAEEHDRKRTPNIRQGQVLNMCPQRGQVHLLFEQTISPNLPKSKRSGRQLRNPTSPLKSYQMAHKYWARARRITMLKKRIIPPCI
ncbi:hypothetical protein BDV32DRAFT_131705 [Aspergillus pseudonomiae]|nr:hypothetical protein BDV32DRAFT_131705 [Aspergillus pseudonomiae]